MSSTYWKKTREAFGRDDIDVYSLRHQCAHLLYVRYDLPAKDVAAQLGNSPRLIENLYGHWRSGATDRLREAIKAHDVPTPPTVVPLKRGVGVTLRWREF
jgi:integrase